MQKVKTGIVGCGNISGIYLKNCTGAFSDVLQVKAVADLIPERAQAKAQEFGIENIYTVGQMLDDPEIEIVVNLTTPAAHASVCLQALAAGKNVYVEKPLSISREDGKKILGMAREKGLLAGGAPDTFLGAGIQTCRKIIQDGVIGDPVAATAFMTCHGHESWHPDPEFYYQAGGGPMFDMGPYYLTALINLMGPVKSVMGAARITFPQRTITSEKKYGKKVDVEVPTHVAGLLNFQSGAVGTIITSFDVWRAHLPRIEIYGSKGSLSVPDPNGFGGPVSLFCADGEAWEDVPLAFGHEENSRGLGVADMAKALREGRAHRANAQMTYHVLDIMHAFHDSAASGALHVLESTCAQPEIMPGK